MIQNSLSSAVNRLKTTGAQSAVIGRLFGRGSDADSAEASQQDGAAAGIAADRLNTPIDPGTVQLAQQHARGVLGEEDRSLVELLNAIQSYVEQHEYRDRPGNAFYEKLLADFNDPESLREPLYASDDELLFVVGADGWAAISEELRLNTREEKAVRDAHQLYARERGLEEYSSLVCVMAVSIEPARVAEIVTRTTPELETEDLSVNAREQAASL